MSAIWAFDRIENKHTLYCGKDCMKKFCESLGKQAKNMIDLTVCKRRIKITSSCKSMLCLQKTNVKKAL